MAPDSRGQPRRSVALNGLFLFGAFAVLYVGQSLFVPLTFALMLYFVFRPLVRAMGRGGVPAALGAAMVLAGLTGAMGLGLYSLAEPASEWVQRLPQALRSVERKVIPLRQPVAAASKLADRVERITQVDQPRPVREVAVDKPGLLESAVGTVRALLSGATIMLITLFFMLVWGEHLLERLMALVPSLAAGKPTTAFMAHVERRMSSYMRTVLGINLALGATIGLAMYLLGMPNPILWGVLAAVVNFVPYLGPLVGIVLVALAGLLTFSDTTSALLPAAVYLGVATVEGNFISPIIIGRAFRLSPLVIFVWLVLWAWLWGLAGALIAVPLLMLLKIAGEHSESLRPVAALLQH